MKHRIKIQLFIVMFTIISAIIIRLVTPDCGISSLKTTNDAYKINCDVDYIITDKEYNTFVKYENDYIDSVSNSSIIAVVKPTGNICQYQLNLGQEVIIQKVIKGNGIYIDDTTYIYGNKGLSIYTSYDKDLNYYSIKNLMLPGHEYLVFIDPLEINIYLKKKEYRLVDSFFNYLDLNNESSSAITATLQTLKLSELREFEFFCNSQKTMDILLSIKNKIISKYYKE